MLKCFSQFKRELCDWSASDNGSDDTREMKKDRPGDGSQDMAQDYQNVLKMKDIKSLKMDYDQDRSWKKEVVGGGGGDRKQITSSSFILSHGVITAILCNSRFFHILEAR